MTDIRNACKHLVVLEEKLKKMRAEMKEINQIKKRREEEITRYLRAHDNESMVVDSVVFALKNVQRAKRARQAEERSRVIDVLRKRNVRDPEEVLRDLKQKPKVSQTVLKLQ